MLNKAEGKKVTVFASCLLCRKLQRCERMVKYEIGIFGSDVNEGICNKFVLKRFKIPLLIPLKGEVDD